MRQELNIQFKGNNNFSGNSSNNALVRVYSGVTIENLIFDATNTRTPIHGLNIISASNVNLNDVTAINAGQSGIVVNASQVTVNNIKTENNARNGIDVDKSGAKLTVNGRSEQADTTPIKKTSIGKVVDTNDQYYTTGSFTKNYYLKSAPLAPTITAPAAEIDTDTTDVVWTAPATQGVNSKINNAKSYLISIDGGLPSTTFNTTYSLTGLSAGEHIVTVQSVAKSGLLGGTATHNFTVAIPDTTNPAKPTDLKFLAKTDGATHSASTTIRRQAVRPTWSAVTKDVNGGDEAIAYYNYKSVGGYTTKIYGTDTSENSTIENWVPTSDLKDGFQVQAVDIAGNVSEWSDILYFTFNNAAPKATVTVGDLSPGGLTNNKNINIKGVGTPTAPFGTDIKTHFFELKTFGGATHAIYSFNNAANRKCALDGANECSFALSDYYDKDGEYKIRYVVTDIQGIRNDGIGQAWAEGISSSTFTFRVDTTLPTVSINLYRNLNPRNLNPTSVIIKAEDKNLNRINVSLRKEGQSNWVAFPDEWISPTGTDFEKDYGVAGKLNLAGLADGKYEIRATAGDAAGNSKNAESRFFTIDRTPPEISILSATKTGANGKTEPGAKVEVRVGESGDWTEAEVNEDGNWSITFSPNLAVGTHQITARATDSAENTNASDTDPEWATETVIVEAEKPATNSGSQTGGGNTPITSLPNTPQSFPPIARRQIAQGNIALTTPSANPDSTESVAGVTDSRAKTDNGKKNARESGDVLAAEDTKDNWSLVNLLLTIFIALASVVSLFGLAGKNKKDGQASKRVLTIIPAIGAVVALLLIEDFGGSMIWVNVWSLLLGVLAVVQVTILSTVRKTTEE